MDLEGGFDIRVRWEKESFAGNDFFSAGNISFVERDDLDESILDEVVDLDKVLVVKSYKDLQNIFLELDDEESGDNKETEKEEVKPPSRQRKSAEPEKEAEPEKSTRRSRTEKKEEPEPEPEKPARRRRNAEPEKPVNPCPSGFVFGDDFYTKTPCEKCEVFDECADKFEADYPAKDEKTSKKETAKETKSGKSSKGSDNECPSGYVFGTDCDNQPECANCSEWDKCMDRQEELEKN